MNKVDLDCSGTIKTKPSEKKSGSITYSKTINFSGIWLYNSGYLLTQQGQIVKNRLACGSKFWQEQIIKVGKISGKYYILTVEEKLVALIGNNTKIILK